MISRKRLLSGYSLGDVSEDRQHELFMLIGLIHQENPETEEESMRMG